MSRVLHTISKLFGQQYPKIDKTGCASHEEYKRSYGYASKQEKTALSI